jgi:FixJ family two-component response regulator
MPNMSGLALLDALHGSECYPPVVAVTGYGDRHTVEELRKRGCDCCLDKPAAPGDVVQSIHDALNLRRAQHINP